MENGGFKNNFGCFLWEIIEIDIKFELAIFVKAFPDENDTIPDYD